MFLYIYNWTIVFVLHRGSISRAIPWKPQSFPYCTVFSCLKREKTFPNWIPENEASKMFFLKAKPHYFQTEILQENQKKRKFTDEKFHILEKFTFADISLRGKKKISLCYRQLWYKYEAFMAFLLDSWMSAYDGL